MEGPDGGRKGDLKDGRDQRKREGPGGTEGAREGKRRGGRGKVEWKRAKSDMSK